MSDNLKWKDYKWKNLDRESQIAIIDAVGILGFLFSGTIALMVIILGVLK